MVATSTTQLKRVWQYSSLSTDAALLAPAPSAAFISSLRTTQSVCLFGSFVLIVFYDAAHYLMPPMQLPDFLVKQSRRLRRLLDTFWWISAETLLSMKVGGWKQSHRNPPSKCNYNSFYTERGLWWPGGCGEVDLLVWGMSVWGLRAVQWKDSVEVHHHVPLLIFKCYCHGLWAVWSESSGRKCRRNEALNVAWF